MTTFGKLPADSLFVVISIEKLDGEPSPLMHKGQDGRPRIVYGNPWHGTATRELPPEKERQFSRDMLVEIINIPPVANPD